MASKTVRHNRPQHHKVTTGCLQCKKSHVKCDESRCGSGCTRCVRLGISCHYPPPIQARVFEPSTTKRFHPLDKPSQEVSNEWSTSRAMYVYCGWAERVFAAYFGHDFWTRFIPQVSHGSLVVKRAITSVASVLESTQSQSHGPLTYIEACGRHQVNVRSIIKAAGETDPEYALLASLLFASCELALGAFDAGILHLTAGSNVLKERMAYLAQNNSSHGLAASILSENIEPIFAAYSRITSVYGIDLVSGDDLTRAAYHGCVQIPACFLNTDQAHAHLRSTIHQIFSNTPPRTLADFEQLQTRLDQWTTALNAFESHQNTNKTSRVMSPMTCFLRNQHRLAQVFLSIARSGEETDPPLFDHFTFDFIWILAQYDLMRFDKVLVSVRVELIPSLFIIATKTNNLQIRNEALRLLEAMTRVEANWDSRTASLIARELFKQEAPVSTSLTLLTQARKTRLPSVARICIHNVSGMWPIGYILAMADQNISATLPLDDCICKHLS